jgi:hypothetical protein
MLTGLNSRLSGRFVGVTGADLNDDMRGTFLAGLLAAVASVLGAATSFVARHEYPACS